MAAQGIYSGEEIQAEHIVQQGAIEGFLWQANRQIKLSDDPRSRLNRSLNSAFN